MGNRICASKFKRLLTLVGLVVVLTLATYVRSKYEPQHGPQSPEVAETRSAAVPELREKRPNLLSYARSLMREVFSASARTVEGAPSKDHPWRLNWPYPTLAEMEERLGKADANAQTRDGRPQVTWWNYLGEKYLASVQATFDKDDGRLDELDIDYGGYGSEHVDRSEEWWRKTTFKRIPMPGL